MLEIEQLVLRIPDVSVEDAQRISQMVAHNIAHQYHDQSIQMNIEQMDLRLSISEGQSPYEMANTISQAIITNINQRSSINDHQGNTPVKSKD